MRCYHLASCAALFSLSGCLSPLPEEPSTPNKAAPRSENRTSSAPIGPSHPTAIIERRVSAEGLRGAYADKRSERSYVRTNMRRDELEYKNSPFGFLFGAKSEIAISRGDLKRQWLLDSDKSEYAECPLRGCKKPSRTKGSTSLPELPHASGCYMNVTLTDINIKATGRKKTINGFSAQEYQVTWVVELFDRASRNTTSTLQIELWTTPYKRSLRDVLTTEKRYERKYSSAVLERGKPIVPAEAADLISDYLAGVLNKSNSKAFWRTGSKMDRIKGYPVYTSLSWRLGGDACRPEDSGPMPVETLLTYSSEVTSLQMANQPDSLFSVPPQYELAARR